MDVRTNVVKGRVEVEMSKNMPTPKLGYIPLSIGLSILIVVTGCASGPLPCESIVEVNRQRQECEQLRKTMNRTSYPQQALTARKQYEENCVNLRYYRDEYDTICKGDRQPIGEEKNRKQ